MESKMAKFIKLILANGALGYLAWDHWVKGKAVMAGILLFGMLVFSYIIWIAKKKE